MRRLKQILAIIAVVLLAALYIITLVLAIMGNENTFGWFLACIFCTVVIPVLMWVISWLYNMIKNNRSKDTPEEKDDSQD